MKIYMFHYVTSDFNYYHFDKNRFEDVIKKLSNSKKIISLNQLKDMTTNNENLNDDYIMLTFDDGTIDHYKYVYPILKKYNVSGLFFVCSNIFENRVLDIHFIHKLLSIVSVEQIYDDIQIYLSELGIDIKYNINKQEKYNSKESYVKKLLQSVLPKDNRIAIIDKLNKKYDVSIQCSEYYMSIQNMLEMKNNNMYFGCHTASHIRLNYLNREEKEKEIKNNMILLYDSKILNKKDVLSIAYPFGAYDKDTIQILKKLKFDFAFTTIERDADGISKYEMPRYDCKRIKE